MNSVPTSSRPLDYLGLERAITRNAGIVIKDANALLVLRFIADRTFGWSKDAEFISPAQFLNGIVTRAGELVCAGLPIGKTTFYAALKILKAADAIAVETVRGRARYSIPKEFAVSLKKSKAQLRAEGLLAPVEYRDMGDDFGIEEQPEGVRHANYEAEEAVRQTNGKESHHPYGIEEERRSEAVASHLAGPTRLNSVEQGDALEKTQAALSEVIEAGAARRAAYRDRLAARGAEHKPLALFEGFASAAREAWPEMTPLTTPTWKELGRLKNHSKAWRGEDITFFGFLEWVAANWRGVWASKMEHVSDKEKVAETFSALPTVRSFLIYHQMFRDSYDRRASQKIRAGLTREDEIVRRLMFKGYTYGDALRDAQEIMAKDRKREDLNARAKEINEAARRLERAQQDPEYRLAVARIRSGKDAQGTPVKPVSLTQCLKPSFLFGCDEIAPLPPFPSWPDEPEEGPDLVAA